MHWIQRHILKQLVVSDSCRYSDLIPDGVDGNLFIYHLKQLINENYVKKDEKNYQLTKEGKSFVGGLSLEKGKPTRVPRIFTMIFSKNKEGEILLYKWNRQPYLDHVSLPFNRVLYGQSTSETANETLKFKTGLEGSLEYKGTAEIITKDDGKVTTHYIANVYAYIYLEGGLSTDGLTGQPFWGKIEEFSGSDWVYGTKEIIELLETKKSPFFEEIVVIK